MEEQNPQSNENIDKAHNKEFGLSSWSITNRTTVWVITTIILLGGLISYIQVPKESFPEIIIPEIFITTAYPGNSPEDIEKLITRPLEKELNAITGIDEMTSTSQQGFSTIDIKFDFDVTPTEALRKVKDKVDIALSDPDFPDDLPADPNVIELNFSELIPIMNINLSGDYSLDDLEDYAEILEERIEDLPQISKVDIKGVMDKEVVIELDYLAMEARELSFGDVAGAVAGENLTISGGDLKVDDFRRSVRVVGEFGNMDDIRNIIVKSEGGHIVYLRDVANVSFIEKEKESYAREYLNPVVSLDVIKRAGENLIEASESINAIIDEAKANDLPPNLQITLTNDQSDMTVTQVSELENSIIFGILLVVGVLLFFLGLRNALFVGVAIPLSMFMSFMILSAAGITLNVMVLFSLVLALGMLVDNGIVVVENIYRLMDEGLSPVRAAKNGVGEVAWPIIASTATTLAAFVPLMIWPGMMGEFMKYLPLTLIIVLSSSLFVALVINPMLTSVFMKVHESDIVQNRKQLILSAVLLLVALMLTAPGSPAAAIGYLPFLVALVLLLSKYMFVTHTSTLKDVLPGVSVLIAFGILNYLIGNNGIGNILTVSGLFGVLNLYVLYPLSETFKDKFLPWLEDKYRDFVSYAMRGINPILTIVGMIVLFFVSFFLLGIFTPKVEFFPSNQPQYLNVFIEKPIGTDIESTNEISQEIEARVLEVLGEDQWKRETEDGKLEDFLVTSVIGQVGNGTSDPAQGPVFGNTPNKARITVSFVKAADRTDKSTVDVLNRLREALSDYPDAEIVVSKNEDGPPQGAPINIEIAGDNYDTLMFAAEEMREFINSRRIAGIEELKIDVNKQMPEMPIKIDRDKARRFGLSTGQIGDAIRTALFGREISTYKEGEDDYPINMRFKQEYRDDPGALLNQKITFRDPSNGRIKQVPISAVASASYERSFSAVKRKDMERVITITSNVLEGYNANEVVASIKRELVDFNAPSGATYDFTGQQEEQAKEMSFLGTAFLIAVFLILLIIVAQFNSFSTPVIIIASVMFSLIGVLLGLVIFQMNFVIIMTMIGIISLAGVVVNNAIVLIDYTNLLRERRRNELGIVDGHLPFHEVIEAIVRGGQTRLRPVLLTAITTVLGLLPLAMGINIDFIGLFTEFDPHFYVGGDNVIFWGPMSWAIIFGLTFATFLTLVVVPVMYLLLARLKYKWVFKEPVK
ncbi:MAG: efflux RND transporter permease subunit [Flavobacteriales bacterium]|nr:efflux RND transporter permease subunit [Flavobacteriales bacterium]